MSARRRWPALTGCWRALAAQLLLHGNAYVQLIAGGRWSAGGDLPLRPERVSVEADERGWPAAYLYRVAGRGDADRARDALGRRQVAHLKALHPRDDHYGLGCLGAAARRRAVHNRASRWNKALLDNAARPSGALVYEPADGSTLVGRAVRAAEGRAGRAVLGKRECRAAAAARGRAEVAGAEPDPGRHGLRRAEGGAAREIALAFGVPPVLVGLPGDATYANAREAGRAL